MNYIYVYSKYDGEILNKFSPSSLSSKLNNKHSNKEFKET